MKTCGILFANVVLIALNATLLVGQERRIAAPNEQKQLEVAIAVRMADEKLPGLPSLNGFVLDDKRYHLPMSGMRGPAWEHVWGAGRDSASRHLAENAATQINLSSRDAAHAERLATQLKTEPVPANACESGLRECRFGSRQGIVAFAPAFIKGDSAQVAMYKTFRNSQWNPSNRLSPPFYSTVYHFLLVRKGNDWHVVQIVLTES